MAADSPLTDPLALAGTLVLSMYRTKLANSIIHVATGQAITSASDNPSGLIASESLKSRLAELNSQMQGIQATSNQASTADGALSQVSSLLQEANRLTLANADSTLPPDQKSANQAELNGLINRIDQFSQFSTFAGRPLLDGSAALSAGSDQVNLPSMTIDSLGKTTIDGTDYTLKDVLSDGAISSKVNPAAAQQVIQTAIEQVSTARGQIGAFQANTLQSQANATAVAFENLSAANSEIADTNYASEVSQLIRLQMLSDATSTLLGSTRRASHRIMALFKG